MEVIINQLESSVRSIEFKIKDIQFNVDWMLNANSDVPGMYSIREIATYQGKILGLLIAIEILNEDIQDIKQGELIKDSMINMLNLLDKMNKLIDNEQSHNSFVSI